MNTPRDNVIRVRGRWSRAGSGDQPESGFGFTDADFDSAEVEEGIVREQTEFGTGYIVQRGGLYLVSATLMLNHTGAGNPWAIRILDLERADPVLRQWNNYSTAKDYLSWHVSAVIPVAAGKKLTVQWFGASSLIARETMGNECSWLEITRLGGVWIKSQEYRIEGPVG